MQGRLPGAGPATRAEVNRLRDILDPIAKWWDTGEVFGLATVVRTFHSAPREPGAAMAVSAAWLRCGWD